MKLPKHYLKALKETEKDKAKLPEYKIMKSSSRQFYLLEQI